MTVCSVLSGFLFLAFVFSSFVFLKYLTPHFSTLSLRVLCVWTTGENNGPEKQIGPLGDYTDNAVSLHDFFAVDNRIQTPRAKQIMVDLPAQPPKTCLRLSTLDLSQVGRSAEASGKRRRIWPRGRFGLIFGAKSI